MVQGIAERAKVRQSRLMDTLRRLENDELRFQVQQSYGDSERTIDEWHDFVEGLDRATRAKRGWRREQESLTDESDRASRFEYLCTVGRKGYRSGVKVA